MGDYPIGSTAKSYFDIDGNPCTLRQLIRKEPEWAHSRIVEGEKAIAKVAQLKAGAKERDLVIEWYGEQAEALHRYLAANKIDAADAVIAALSLDAGKRAKRGESDDG